jgi:hypothetical protein
VHLHARPKSKKWHARDDPLASYRYGAPDAYFYFSGARELVTHYALLNPHATFAYINGVQVEYASGHPTWSKWTPKAPTSPHWYTPQQFRALLRAFVNASRQTKAGPRLLSDVLQQEFDGFAGSAARGEILRPLQLTGATLDALLDDGDIDRARAHALLAAMQRRARPVDPKRLGVLGGAYLVESLATLYAVDTDTIVYRTQKGTTDGLPYVLEVACGQRRVEDAARQLLCGFNFTPALGVPFAELPWICGTADVQTEDPVTLMVHVTCPRLDATDRGKTAVTLPGEVDAALRALVMKAAEPWTKLKAKVRREGRQRALEEDRERRKQRPISVKEAAWQVMEAAYLKASDQGRLPANARQIMYAARPEIIRLTGKEKPWKHSSYFTQHLLPDFLEAHLALTADWDVVFDARGHFREPHTAVEFGMGTLEVREYCFLWKSKLETTVTAPELAHAIETQGPWSRYKHVLFIEKEGFTPLLDRAQLQARYDVGLMSTKGMTVTAARWLIEKLSKAGVTLLVAHDFDKSGLEILHKFTADTRRYRYTSTPMVIDLGLRLEEALAMGLEREPVTYDSGVNPKVHLRECGATEAECAFLVQGRTADEKQWYGDRIELNAMDSRQFLDWLERKLQEAGVKKVIPEEDVLATAYRRQRRIAKLQKLIDAAMAETDDDAPIPDDLVEQIRERITGKEEAWDDALWGIAQEQLDEEEETDA